MIELNTQHFLYTVAAVAVGGLLIFGGKQFYAKTFTDGVQPKIRAMFDGNGNKATAADTNVAPSQAKFTTWNDDGSSTDQTSATNYPMAVVLPAGGLSDFHGNNGTWTTDKLSFTPADPDNDYRYDQDDNQDPNVIDVWGIQFSVTDPTQATYQLQVSVLDADHNVVATKTIAVSKEVSIGEGGAYQKPDGSVDFYASVDYPNYNKTGDDPDTHDGIDLTLPASLKNGYIQVALLKN